MDTTLIDAVALTAVVSFVLSLIKPFVELLPFARPGSPAHDATLRILHVLLNVGAVLGVAASLGTLTQHNALPLALQALAQMAGGQVLYTTMTRSGQSVGDSGSTTSLGVVRSGIISSGSDTTSTTATPVATSLP